MNRESHIASVALIVLFALAAWFGYICPNIYLKLSKNTFAFFIAYSIVGLISLNIQYPISTLFVDFKNKKWLIVNSVITWTLGSSFFIFLVTSTTANIDILFTAIPIIFLGFAVCFTMLPIAFIWRAGKIKSLNRSRES